MVKFDVVTSRLILLLLSFCAGTVVSAEWISPQHRCALKIPETESWIAARRPPIPVGEILFHSTAMRSNDGILVTVIPDLPARELTGDGLLRRITATLESEGFTPETPAAATWMHLPAFEVIARRRDSVFGTVLGVARAVRRGTDLFIVMAYGKGEADKSRDPYFTRILDTFRFVEPSALANTSRDGPSVGSYKVGAVACVSAALLLVTLFLLMVFKTRHVPDGA